MFTAPNGNRCRIIVIEGPDKTGKATQSALLLANLAMVTKSNGESLRVTKQEIAAQDGITYDKIYKMLKSGDASRFPATFQAFHTSNRLIWQAQQLPKLGSKYDVIILDRWTISSWVYGSAAGVPEDEIECLCEDLIKPDLVFTFLGSAFKTPERPDDCYEADQPFQERVRELYGSWVCRNRDIALGVDANRFKEVIAEELLNHCRERLRL